MDEKAVRGVPWTMLTFGATKVVNSLTTVVLARLLAPSDFGLFALATLGLGLLSIFNGNWLGATLIVRADVVDDRTRGTVLTLVLASGVLMAAALALVSPIAAAAFHQPRLEEILLVFAGVLLFSGVNWFYEMIMQRELEFRRRFVAQIARSVVFSVVALTLGLLGAGVWSLIGAQVASHVANGVVLFSLAPYRVRPAFDRSRVRVIVSGSRGFLGQELADFFQQNLDYISVGQLRGAVQLGYYSLGYRQAELPYYAIGDPVGTVTFPAFARMRHAGKDVTRPFLTALRLVCFLTCPLGIILSAAAKPFTEALFGAKWLPMTGVLAVMGLWAIMRPLQVTFGRLLNSMGAAWLYGRISVLGLGPFAVATVLAAKFGGINAVAAVLLVYIMISATLLMRIVSRRAGIPMRQQWSALRPMFVAGGVCWLVTRATANAMDAASPLLALIVSAGVCLVVYVLIVHLGDRQFLRTALRQAQRAMPRRQAAIATS